MNCYVSHNLHLPNIPEGITRKNTIFFPEKTMSIMDQHRSGCPDKFHIVTNSPDLVGLYDREDVFVWNEEDKRWEHPFCQTYAADLCSIRQEVFGINVAIPRATVDGDTTNCMGHPLKKVRV